jgi:hypothetical protein
MNAGVITTGSLHVSTLDRLFAKFGRAINKIGYHRAAAELSRIGYTEEAKKCLEQLKQL